MTLRKPPNGENVFRYVITETPGPSSLDPLNADQTDNLPVARMIYATPLEVNTEGNLSSKVLENFSYDPDNRTMAWTVRRGLHFSDGSDITPEDVAFAVARMAFVRPTFPVIEDIAGVQTWSKGKDALRSLPEGIAINDQKISIKFKKDQEHPLFRFSLEIFSIIPKKCVDLSTNKLNCDPVPTSGYYKIADKTADKIDFQLVEVGGIHGAHAPSHIQFRYAPSVADTFKQADKDSVVAGNEIRFLPEAITEIRHNTSTVFAPAARIAILLLKPTGVFKDKVCRRVFADTYREAFSAFVKGQLASEASMFTDILPGYMKSTSLAQSSPISPNEKERCLALFREKGIPWAKPKQAGAPVIFDIVTEQALRSLGVSEAPAIEVATRVDLMSAFSDGNSSLLVVNTGFWELDPAGDVQMLFTPNMHKMLQFVANDDKAQKLIRGLKTSSDKAAAYKALNQYLYDEALFNVFSHVRRFYSATNSQLIANLPMSITSPAPWQVFRMAP